MSTCDGSAFLPARRQVRHVEASIMMPFLFHMFFLPFFYCGGWRLPWGIAFQDIRLRPNMRISQLSLRSADTWNTEIDPSPTTKETCEVPPGGVTSLVWARAIPKGSCFFACDWFRSSVENCFKSGITVWDNPCWKNFEAAKSEKWTEDDIFGVNLFIDERKNKSCD